MYCYLIWQVNNPFEWAKYHQALQNVLQGNYNWVRPLNDLYIVQINNSDSYDSLFTSVTALARSFPGKVNFFLSQVLEGGGYNGFIQKEKWEGVHNLTGVNPP